ncbi:MAG: hypothetical protein JWR39_2176 [Devosia sp.]|nr:hypothetical protein [Devosia sp.]
MRRFGPSFAIALLVCLGLGAGAAQGQQTGAERQARVIEFAANNSLFVLYHEMAHLLVDQLGLPVLGREEDAADNMASWILLNKGTPEAGTALTDAARGWLLSGLVYGAELDDSDFYGNHSLDRQRAFQIVCLMVGSDVEAYTSVANAYAIDPGRQDTCPDDYRLVNRSLGKLLAGRDRKKSKTRVEVSFQAVSGALRGPAEAFEASGVFEQVADELRRNYSLRKPVQLNAKRCGEANAFYDPDTVEIIFCYEMMQDFMALYTSQKPGKAVPLP